MLVDLKSYILIDHHAHSLRNSHRQLDALGFRSAFSESRSFRLLDLHVPRSLHYRQLLLELGELLGIEGEEAILDYRSRAAEREYVNSLWDDVSIGALIVDDGFMPDEMLSLERLASICGRPVFRCLRLETVLEESIRASSSFREAESSFLGTLRAAAGAGTVSLKTIAAYRGGLDIECVTAAEAKGQYDAVKSMSGENRPFRIERCALYHYLLSAAFELACELGLPVQVHCGLGDDDADLRQANPLCLRSVLRSERFAGSTFVLLHCYPFVAEAAYLAGIYPNVYFDLSLSVSLAAARSRDMILDALALAPFSKLLFGTDGHTVPESHWFAARVWKRSLTEALGELAGRGFITGDTAADVAAAVLHENARQLYALDGLS